MSGVGRWHRFTVRGCTAASRAARPSVRREPGRPSGCPGGRVSHPGGRVASARSSHGRCLLPGSVRSARPHHGALRGQGERMPARTSCHHALLALVMGCLLFLASPVPTERGDGGPGAPVPAPAGAGDTLAVPRAPTVQPVAHSSRMTGRAGIATGQGLALPRSSGIVHADRRSGGIVHAERAASLMDPTSSGPGHQLAVGAVVADLAISASRSPRDELAIAAACSTPQDTCRARAPPGLLAPLAA